MQQLSLPLCFNPGRSFEDFWVHPKNAELMYHLQGLIEPKGVSALFLWGRPVSGKTHLLEAMCKRVDEFGLRAGYVDFSEVAHLSTAVLDDLDTLDVVCLDNIHTLDHEDHYHFQVAVFNLFNELRAQQKSLIITSEKPVQKLSHMIPDLTSRLRWGLVYQLLGFEQLDPQELLQWSAKHRGMLMSQACADYILKHYARDGHALVSLLDRLEKDSLMEQRKLTIPFIRKVMDSVKR